MNENRAILITGARGGLGRAAVRAFSSAGYRVFAADITPPDEDDPLVFPIVMDVTSDESVSAAAETIKARGGLYAILHMSGVYTMDSFIEIEPGELEKMLAVNLMGVYRVNRIMLPLIQKGGRIAITASELAPLDPLPFNGIYSMTKTALASYSNSLALELDLIGIRVVTLYPGAFGDGMPKASVRAMDRMKAKTRLYPVVSERFRNIVISETGKAKSPDLLAKRILRILERKRPPFRCYINNSLKLRLFSALPMGAQAFLLRLLLKPKTE
ncbi:MAG: SDR family NAD(P)-dependent oxidoreductase [Clostridiales bacterium]|nr:SDR family NAD(P)-dependent oxidoreductase [Clostridiales bacterium]